jgi:hypothetical protein
MMETAISGPEDGRSLSVTLSFVRLSEWQPRNLLWLSRLRPARTTE